MGLTDTISYGWYTGDNRRPIRVCAYDQNQWIPLYAYDKFFATDDERKYYTLDVPIGELMRQETKDLRPWVENQSYIGKFKFPKTPIDFYARKGMIFEIQNNGYPKILLCAGYTTELATPDEYRLFLHPHVLSNTLYTRIKYYILKYWIDDMSRYNYQTVITNNIESLLFNPVRFDGDLFRSIDEEVKFLESSKGFIASVVLRESAPSLPEPEQEETQVETNEESSSDFNMITSEEVEETLEGLPDINNLVREFSDAEEPVQSGFQWADSPENPENPESREFIDIEDVSPADINVAAVINRAIDNSRSEVNFGNEEYPEGSMRFDAGGHSLHVYYQGEWVVIPETIVSGMEDQRRMPTPEHVFNQYLGGQTLEDTISQYDSVFSDLITNMYFHFGENIDWRQMSIHGPLFPGRTTTTADYRLIINPDRSQVVSRARQHGRSYMTPDPSQFLREYPVTSDEAFPPIDRIIQEWDGNEDNDDTVTRNPDLVRGTFEIDDEHVGTVETTDDDGNTHVRIVPAYGFTDDEEMISIQSRDGHRPRRRRGGNP